MKKYLISLAVDVLFVFIVPTMLSGRTEPIEPDVGLKSIAFSTVVRDDSPEVIWAQVKKAQKDKLPRTALELLDRLMVVARARGNFPWQLKALASQIDVRSGLDRSSLVASLRLLKQEIQDSGVAERPPLQILLAGWYERYLDWFQNEISARTPISGALPDDLEKWSAVDFRRLIEALYDSALSDPASLAGIPAAPYAAAFLLEDQSRGIPTIQDILAEDEPTLLDLLAGRAFCYYNQQDREMDTNESKEELAQGLSLLGTRETFLCTLAAINAADTSPKAKEIRILGTLLKTHSGNGNRRALLAADFLRLRTFMDRVKFDKNYGRSANREYIHRLESLVAEFPEEPGVAQVFYELSRAWEAENDFGKSLAAAEAAAVGFPKSWGGRSCRDRIQKLLFPSLDLTMERCVPPGASKLKVDYRNVGRVYFKLYHSRWVYHPWNKGQVVFWRGENPVDRMLARTPLAEWSVDLPDATCFTPRSLIVKMPDVPPGYYTIVAGTGSDFDDASNIQYAGFWVTRMTVVYWQRDGAIDGFALDAVTGEPMAGVDVCAVFAKTNRDIQILTQIQTGADGHFTLPRPQSDQCIQIELRQGNERVVAGDVIGIPSPEEETLFYTDRAIYRPGQEVQFKGVCIQVSRANASCKVIPGRKVTICLLDPNADEIGKLERVTNAFGSFSGSFIVPANRLTGEMKLECQEPEGTSIVRVEEYRRPGFRVELRSPNRGARLGTEVTVEGSVETFSGAPVDGTAVTWRVTRQTRCPEWGIRRSGFSAGFATGQETVAQGQSKTEAKGRFVVRFTPMAEDNLPEENQAYYAFTVAADVTDPAGETESAQSTVMLGDSDIVVGIQAEALAREGEPLRVTLLARTLDDASSSAIGTVEVYRLSQPKATLWENTLQETEGKNSAGFTLDWQRWPEAERLRQVPFTADDSGKVIVPIDLPHGLYLLKARASSESGRETRACLPLLVWPGATVKHFNLPLPSEVALRSTRVAVGETLEAMWGSGFSSGRCLVEVEHRGRVLHRLWTPPDETFHAFSYPVGEELRGGFQLRITHVHDGYAWLQVFPIEVPWDNKLLNVSVESFRSRLEPGEKETIRLKVQEGKKVAGETKSVDVKDGQLPAANKPLRKDTEIAAALYDASLDRFTVHTWRPFDFFPTYQEESPWGTFSNELQKFNTHRNDWSAMNKPDQEIISNLDLNLDERYLRQLITDKRYFRQFSIWRVDPRFAMLPGVYSGIQVITKSGTAQRATADVEVVAHFIQVETTTSACSSVVAGRNPSMNDVVPRKHLQETAFFHPQLVAGPDGSVVIPFTAPEALTRWKLLVMAHDADCRNGLLEASLTTWKQLMVWPEPPRFLREGDTLDFTARVMNQSASSLSGAVQLDLADLATGRPLGDAIIRDSAQKAFTIPAGASQAFSWRLEVPRRTGQLKFTVRVAAGELSDGEDGVIQVLPDRIPLTDSIPIMVQGPRTREFAFPRLGETATNKAFTPVMLTVQASSNPAWYALRALPYLMEFPHECSEQVFNRAYAAAVALKVAGADPRIREVLARWRAKGNPGSTLERNPDLTGAVLSATPWANDAAREDETLRRVGQILEESNARQVMRQALETLQSRQLSGGGWPWFPGGKADLYITAYIAAGFGRLRLMSTEVDVEPALAAIHFLDSWAEEHEAKTAANPHRCLDPMACQYLYSRSFFLKDLPLPASTHPAVDNLLRRAREHWGSLTSILNQGQLALALARFGDLATARSIAASLKERAVPGSDGVGLQWPGFVRSWAWQNARVESQALMAEVFSEVLTDTAAVEGCKAWLVMNKRTSHWGSTRATADAIYALLLCGENLLKDTSPLRIFLGDEEVKPQEVEAGTGFFEVRRGAGEIRPEQGRIRIEKDGPGLAWGGVHLQYLADVAAAPTFGEALRIEKELFLTRQTPEGKRLEPISGPVVVGDLLTVRLTLKVAQELEYVHLEDMRGSGLEPVAALSGAGSAGSLWFYHSIRDTADHFFFDCLPAGMHVLEYTLRVVHGGHYQAGLVEIRCMYAPEFAGRSNSIWIDAVSAPAQ